MPVKTTLALLLIYCLFAASCAKNQTTGIPNTKDSLILFIMAGQSNMAGRAHIEAQDTIADPRILMMDSNGHFVIAKEPFHFDFPGYNGLDCGHSFAISMLPYMQPGIKIGLIPCAYGSTSIEQWIDDSLSHNLHLYTNLLKRARIGMETGVIKGILWHQGESDAEDTRSLNYAANLQKFVHHLRQDLNDHELPFYAAELAPFLQRPYFKQVNAGIEQAANMTNHLFVIKTNDLTGGPDSVHFDTNGERGLGRHFAEKAKFYIY